MVPSNATLEGGVLDVDGSNATALAGSTAKVKRGLSSSLNDRLEVEVESAYGPLPLAQSFAALLDVLAQSLLKDEPAQPYIRAEGFANDGFFFMRMYNPYQRQLQTWGVMWVAVPKLFQRILEEGRGGNYRGLSFKIIVGQKAVADGYIKPRLTSLEDSTASLL